MSSNSNPPTATPKVVQPVSPDSTQVSYKKKGVVIKKKRKKTSPVWLDFEEVETSEGLKLFESGVILNILTAWKEPELAIPLGT